MVARGDLGCRAAAGDGPDRAEACGRARAALGEAGDRRDADARIDDRKPRPDPRRDLRRRQRRARRRGRRHAVRRDERRRSSGRRRWRRWRASSPRPRTTASPHPRARHEAADAGWGAHARCSEHRGLRRRQVRVRLQSVRRFGPADVAPAASPCRSGVHRPARHALPQRALLGRGDVPRRARA